MQFLKRADHIVMLEQGKVVGQGSYLQLTESGALSTALELDIETKGQEAARRASQLSDMEHSKDCDDEDTAVDMEQAQEQAQQAQQAHVIISYSRDNVTSHLVVSHAQDVT